VPLSQPRRGSPSRPGLVTFKDVTMSISQEEWEQLDPDQVDFYGEYVPQENCDFVVSLGKNSPAPHPPILEIREQSRDPTDQG
uniref:KRAB domain-containing protein n=1 Tax=Ornithorhynchus anatinus TaxID=9258 RepID=F7AAL0_ORNAN